MSKPTTQNASALFQGMTTMVLTAEDVELAASWYAEALDAEPYFRMPAEGPAAYVEFRLGPDQDELGIMSRAYAPGSGGRGTSTTHWNVADVTSALAHLVERGATEYAPVTDRGEGFVTASVVDPFGNVVGLMHSPHWDGRH